VAVKYDGGRGQRPPRFQTTTIYRQANPTTPAIKINPVTCAACREAAARASHVRAPGDRQRRLCRKHWQQERLREDAEGVRRQFFQLFRNQRPLGVIPGAAPAPIGGEGRATT